MNHAAVAGILASLLTAPAQIAAQAPASGNTPLNAERIESGVVHAPGGDRVSYSIRLLPVSSFPDLPEPVKAQLTRRGCMIPQSFEAKQPENVIHGAFRAAGTQDWAVLCSAAGFTTLYVFFAGHFEAPVNLRMQPDSAWLGAEPGSAVFGSSWGIAVRSVSELRSTPRLRAALNNPDHDAIDDARLERSLTIHYYQAGTWVSLNPDDYGD